ncbi:MAG: Uma2 family endonuclease [Drouetiella hepatica Uher 2000/2452]|jgi:Uma2 family endonuclease|uniref:Uma2 family endonuclease n=1 Tax=Drouetiella hepatica Uher 2000/2452 TaxID=904376 RepID=A0A951QDX5_9CYAN|nr:Uma2 family endonuclease [Drouetiella hepatica Uher 2000/2452]
MVDATPKLSQPIHMPLDWQPLPPDNLIFDDGEPLETNRHRIAMNLLIRSLPQAMGERTNYFTGGNMFVYYSRNQAMNRDFRGSDFFVVLDVESDRERQGWVVWEEEGRYPDVIVELLSSSTAKIDQTIKKDLYERIFKTSDYFVFDPFDASSFAGWTLVRNQYQPLQHDDRGWLWCESLGLWLGAWQGIVDREPTTGSCHWLRFYNSAGELVPLPEEAAQQQLSDVQQQLLGARQQLSDAQRKIDQERQQHEALIAKLRQRGIDPDDL